VTGISAALAAVAIGLLAVEVVTLLSWVAESRSAAPLSAALRTGAAFWLLGHGGRLHLPAGTAALIPLGLTLLFGALAARAGAAVARACPSGPRPRTIVTCAAAVSVPYAVLATFIAAVTSGGGLHTSIPTTLVGSCLLAAAGAAVGAARELPLARPKPDRIRATAAAVATAGGVLLAVSALITAIALVTHLSDAASLARPEKAGAVGGLGLFVLQAVLAPNVTVWSSAYLLGPGFAVGSGSLVSPSGVRLGDVPALPVLGGLPSSAVPWPLYALFLIPIAAGVLAGVVLVRRLPHTPKLGSAALLGSGAGLCLGAAAGIVAALSGGPITRGRLTTVGPSPWQTGMAAALEVGIPCAAAAVLVSWRRCPRRSATPVAPEPQNQPQKQQPQTRLGWAYRLVVHGPAARAATRGVKGAARQGQRGREWLVGQARRATGQLSLLRPSRAVNPGPAVDLTKHEPCPVDLTKHHEEPAVAKRRRLRVPWLGKRKSKVVKLPD
jgi:hypothetical protein